MSRLTVTITINISIAQIYSDQMRFISSITITKLQT